MRSDRIPKLIEEPASVEVWRRNRIEVFAALMGEFQVAAEEARPGDCIDIAGIWANFAQVVTSDLGVVFERIQSDSISLPAGSRARRQTKGAAR